MTWEWVAFALGLVGIIAIALLLIVWMIPRPDVTYADGRITDGVVQAEMERLLREAYHRLMISEGNARYIDNNVKLAEEIAAELGIEA